VVMHTWLHPTPGYARERFIVDLDGEPIGMARHLHPVELKADSYSSVQVYLVPEAATAERLAEVYEFIEGRTVADGVKTMETGIHQDDQAQSSALVSRGWRRDRVAKVWELDLVRHRERLLEIADESRSKLKEQGIRCLTLAADTDPQRHVKVHEMLERAVQDIPTTLPIRPAPLSEFMANLASPDIDESRFWVARDGDRCVGLSHLRYPPVSGNVWTGITATSREYRGRGIARGVKMETLVQAIELGIPRVRTDNDEENAPMLHINKTLGYDSIPSHQSYIKKLEWT